MRGYAWAGASVLLVTLAQLLMKWGMQQLPPPTLNALTPAFAIQYVIPLLAVALGILGYVLSMVCWFYTLLFLPLSTAYPLVSISYALVYCAAVLLPMFHETASLAKTLGVGFILFGVWLINRRQP